MKKYGLITFVILALMFAFAHMSYAETDAGEVLTVKKEVSIIRNDQKTDAKPRMSLLLKDAVETGRKSRTKLFFKDDSILNLGELSMVKVEQFLYSPEKKRSKSIYRLIDGSLKVVVGRSDLEIHTPTAVAAARGTKFIIWAEGSESSVMTCTMVFDGEVLVKNIDEDIKGTETVKAGNISCVPVGMPPEPAVSIRSEEKKKFTRGTTVAGEIFENRNVLPPKEMVWTSDSVMSGMAGPPPVAQEPATALTPVTIKIVFPE